MQNSNCLHRIYTALGMLSNPGCVWVMCKCGTIYLRDVNITDLGKGGILELTSHGHGGMTLCTYVCARLCV